MGKAFDQLTKTDIDELLSILAKDLEKIKDFKDKWYKRLRDEMRQSFRARVNLAYTRAHKNEKILDIEVNLAEEAGRNLARLVSHADFKEALATYDTRIVRLHQGVFRDELKSSAEVSVNLLGWGSEGIVTLFREVDEAIEPQGSGLLHIYTSRAYIERKKKRGWRFKEEVYSKFLLNAVAHQSQAEGQRYEPMVAALLRSLTGEYQLMHRDEKTSVDELAERLRFAAMLGLLDCDPTAFAKRLCEDCGGDLGEVSVSYRVQFSHQDLLTAFHFNGAADADGGTLGKLARQAMRDFICQKYGSLSATDWIARVGFAYRSDQAYAWHRSASLTAKLKGVVLPTWFTGEKRPLEVALSGDMVTLVQRLFNYEDSLVNALLQLDPLMDRVRNGQTVNFNQLNEAITGFLKSAESLSEYDTSCFAAILDRLIELSTGGAACRDTIVIVEVSPRNGRLKGETVTRILAAAPKTADTIVEDQMPSGLGIGTPA